MPLGKILANFQKNYKFSKFDKIKFAKNLQKVAKISVARFRKNQVFTTEFCIFPEKVSVTKLGKIWEIWENFTQKNLPDTHIGKVRCTSEKRPLQHPLFLCKTECAKCVHFLEISL